jgi:butyryl-CoA dehydrogenase
MATTNAPVTAKRVKGGSFLTEERQPQDIFTPEDFSEEQRQIAKTTVEFTTNEVMPAADQIEAKNFEITRALLAKAGELGLMAVDVPEAYGGLELDKTTSAVIAESMSQLASFSVAFSAHAGIGTLPLVAIGGLTLERLAGVLAAGADAAAVVTDIVRHEQPEARARAWLAAAQQAPAAAA